MAWTAPMTAVANAVFTAAQFNTHVRDNLLETAPAKATTPGSIFVTDAANAISERIPIMAEEPSSAGTTTSATYTSTLTSGGTNPAVTCDTGTSAIVMLEVRMSVASTTETTWCSYAISGATTSVAADQYAIFYTNPGTSGKGIRMGTAHLRTGLTEGSNTFTMQYKVTGGATGTYQARRITVIPL